MNNSKEPRQDEKVEHAKEYNEKWSSRNEGNNTADGQREADDIVKGDKGHQHQGNYGSRQGEGGNTGSRGNTGLR